MLRFRRETALRVLIFGAMVVVSVFWQLRPINDPDFFWHLKSGEWIWQHRGLPAEDPFNFTSRAIEPARQQFVLTGYWLSDVIYYGTYTLGGIPGIVVLRFLIAALLVLALLRLRRGDPMVQASLVLAALPLLYGFYPFDRPQAFSFLFFAALLVLLERERNAATVPSSWGSYLPLPLLLLVWANMHGGHVVGQVTLLLYIALEGAKFAHPALGPVGRPRYRRLLILGIAGLGASLANPNSYHALAFALVPSPDWVKNLDYLSTVQFYREMGQALIFVFWGTLPLAAVSCLFAWRKPDLTWIALLAGTGYAGFSHMRYVPFFMIAALPAVGLFLSAARVRKWAGPLLAAGSVALAGFFSKDELPSLGKIGIALGVNSDIYPVRAADFIIANDLRGNLYNTYFWGGYLLWRLAPERKVFVDGRGINGQATFQSFSINEAFPGPNAASPYWKELLKRLGVGYMIIPRLKMYQGIVFDEAGNLRKALQDDPDWVPVFADTISLVYLLDAPEHRRVIAEHRIPRAQLQSWGMTDNYARGNFLVGAGRREEAVGAFRQATREQPGNYEAWHNLGCVLGELGRLGEAAAAFEETLRLKPDHPTARRNLEQIPGHRRR